MNAFAHTYESTGLPEYELAAMRAATIDAAVASMRVVRSYQQKSGDIERLSDKSDRSVLTRVDLESEQAAIDVLKQQAPDVPILGEESGMDGTGDSPYLFLVDPIDGTRPFLNGASTSTVITSLIDRTTEKFVSATIGQPATGNLWHATDTEAWRTTLDMETGQPVAPAERCAVWSGSIASNACVLVENFQAFSRNNGTRPILTSEDNIRLFQNLQSIVAIQNYGSNGFHHALVASGGEGLAGSITTSMGGEWDVAGALLVLNAGGLAEGIRMHEDRSLSSEDPLKPFDYDMLLTANNEESLAFLRQSLTAAVQAGN